MSTSLSVGDGPTGRSASSPASLVTPEFITLTAASMFYFMSIGAANPVLPRFVSDELGGSKTQVGIVLGVVAVPSLLARPFLGRLGDRRGARLLIIIGSLVTLIGLFAYLFVDSMPLAIVARLPFGVGSAAVMTGATTLAINLAPLERRGEAASYVLVSVHLGMGTGPLIGEFILDHSSFDGVWIGLGVMCVIAAAIAFFLPKRLGSGSTESGSLIHPAGILPGVVIGLGMMPFIGMMVFAPLYGESIGLDKVGGVFMVASITIAIVRLLTSKVSDRVGPIKVSGAALIVIVAASALLAAWERPSGLYIGATLLSAGGALLMPALMPVAVAGVPEGRLGSAMATFTMFVDVAVALTGPLFGIVAEVTNYNMMFLTGGVAAVFSFVTLVSVLAPRWDLHEAGLQEGHVS